MKYVLLFVETDGLLSANAILQQWAQERGIRWQVTDDSRWGARVERYLTDPSRQPDPSRWETELAYLAVDRRIPRLFSHQPVGARR
ncbi:MAG: hypothetical protein JOZ98_05740 [Solirubrobacterales bacterium]|nr:hypothetical protein [Solirubrobacterales bacterium]MBV9422388.1 hypothetical protein [Solirubrobacterales bacterium]MBV9801505.1 hypothetical protein [Solirubrobacterales bacterium]